MMPLTPNMMLLARSSNYSPPLEYSGDDRFCARLAYVAQVEKEWWDRWVKQVLPTLFSYRKWKDKQKNIEVGDLVMIRYPGQFKDDYCMAKVKEVHPGEDGLVRQVTVCYKKKNTKESPTVYKSKPLITEKVAVHRLHKLHLSDDVVQEGAGKPDDGQGEQDEVDAQPVAGLAYVRVDVQGDEVMCEDVRQRHDSEIIHLAYGNAVVQGDAGKGEGDVQGHCNEGVHRVDAQVAAHHGIIGYEGGVAQNE